MTDKKLHETDDDLTKDERRVLESLAYIDQNMDDDLGPAVKVKVSKNVRNVFSMKIGAEELDELADAAEKTGQSVGAFIREAALARARELDAGENTVAEVQRRARELVEAVNRLPR